MEYAYSPVGKKNDSIFILKSLTILLVVIGHSVPGSSAAENSPFLLAVKDVIYSFHMPLFMSISGYLYATYTIKNSRKYPTIGSFYADRSKKLLVPYFVLGMCGFLLKGLAAKYSFRPYDFSMSFYLNGLIRPTESAVQMYWYVFTLFTIFLFHPLLRTIFRRHNILLHTLIAVFLILLNTTSPLQSTFLNLTGLGKYLVYFFLGGLASRLPIERTQEIGKIPNIVLWGIVFFALYVMSPANNPYFRFLLSLAGIILFSILASWMGNRKITLLQPLYPYTYTIYLLSWFVQNPIRILYQMRLLPYVATIFLMIILGVVFPILIAHFIRRKWPKLAFIVGQ